MKMYFVADPIKLSEDSSWIRFRIKDRHIPKSELLEHLKQLESLRVFTNYDDAINYARSLRINRACHVFSADRRQIAPVYTAQLDVQLLSHFTMTTENINYKEYESYYSNFPIDQTGIDTTINYQIIDKNNFDLDAIEIKKVEFPDTERDSIDFTATAESNQKCVLY